MNMDNVYDKQTISITIFNENGLLGYNDTQWYFVKVLELEIDFDQINNYSNIEDYPCDFEIFSQYLNIIIYRGGRVIVKCWGDTYDVLKMISFFDRLVPPENDLFFSTYEALLHESCWKPDFPYPV